ncbi:tRNA (guanine-N(7)-)-methyltransferase non-catalytic subunit trm82 [Ceratobasidium sp. UAMH 11750]|nr:tRNA (guanine-N(7)-)-methyltransferase non-catalytic subunit trm82 [Ceratobasidium sp. UAMH 11750]
MSIENDQTYPYSHIFVGLEKTIAICGPSIFVLDTQLGNLLSSAVVVSSDATVSAFVRVAAVDKSFSHLVTSGDDKRLRVWSVEKLEELSKREIPKRANVLKLSQDGQTILAADKFGDIFCYPLIPTQTKSVPPTQPSGSAAPTSKSISVAMHDNPEGTLVLGHASIVTAFILTPDEKLIVSADRDEHVRVSWYPDGWDVEKYCMGHKKFISALEIPSCTPRVLISGGGDPELYIWDYRAGKLLTRIPIWETVQPFLKVRGGRKKWKDNGEGKRPSKNTKGKGKQESGKPGETETPEAMDTSPDKPELAGAAFDEEVLVVSHITHARFGPSDVVLFSVVGASALFYFEWPCSLDFEGVIVRSVELLNPVTEYAILEGGNVWVSVDPSWSSGPGAVQNSSPVDQRRVRQLVWRGSAITEASSDSDLLKSLNDDCIVKGSSKDIQTLNLYDSLIALPKVTEPEGAEGVEPEESGIPVPSDITSGPGLRASARQRTKEQLEKRKATTQESAQNQRSTKQPRVKKT